MALLSTRCRSAGLVFFRRAGAETPDPAFFSLFFLLSSSLLSSLHARTQLQTSPFLQIPSDLADKTSPFCCY
jgi:hypothetical protein